MSGEIYILSVLYKEESGKNDRKDWLSFSGTGCPKIISTIKTWRVKNMV